MQESQSAARPEGSRRGPRNTAPRCLISNRGGLPCAWRDASPLGGPSMSSRAQLAEVFRRVWRWIIDDPRAASPSPRPSSRVESVFSLSVLAFAAAALVAIVSKSGGHDLIILVFALAAGAFGASTSIVGDRRPQTLPADSAPAEPPWSTLMVKVAIGAAAAYLFYWLTSLGILAGGLFPDLGPVPDSGAGSAEVARVSVADFTKLMLGCFLAGFTERLGRLIPRRPADRS